MTFAILAVSLDLMWVTRNFQLWPLCLFWFGSVFVRLIVKALPTLRP